MRLVLVKSASCWKNSSRNGGVFFIISFFIYILYNLLILVRIYFMQHIGFIMDGNRRWAKKIGNIIKIWHENGGKTFEQVLEWCYEKEIPFVSFWALSKENILERTEDELLSIYTIIRWSLPRLISQAEERNISIDYVGDIWLLPKDIRDMLIEAQEKTEKNTKMTVILALAYSGQDEIVRGVRRYIAQGNDIALLDEKNFLDFLDSWAFPPPDLIVRTGWATRHSGYFLYQSAYSEYFFTQTLWPDFSRSDLEEALEYFASIKRNFGK